MAYQNQSRVIAPENGDVNNCNNHLPFLLFNYILILASIIPTSYKHQASLARKKWRYIFADIRDVALA
ncbi:MAG: hypothetical protein B6I36_10805 [Desulfobacteraceae bacterium 4572_35.1]|nr:MAG: hypothetical protein B6I36_10805 [Desulfobacteraceae bacterium 4572_35.1]